MDGGRRRRGDPGASNSDAFPNVYALVVYDNDAFRLCMYLVLMTLSLLATLMLIMMWKCNHCTPAARKEPRGFRSSDNYVPICAQCHGANLRQTTADADSARRQPGRITIHPMGNVGIRMRVVLVCETLTPHPSGHRAKFVSFPRHHHDAKTLAWAWSTWYLAREQSPVPSRLAVLK